MLLFGLDQKEHAQFLENLGGSKLQFNFIMNATALFMIPIMMQMVVDPACFHNVFISQDPTTLIFTYTECIIFFQGVCYGKTAPSTVSVSTTAPFVYNYSCSAAVIRAYAPVYERRHNQKETKRQRRK